LSCLLSTNNTSIFISSEIVLIGREGREFASSFCYLPLRRQEATKAHLQTGSRSYQTLGLPAPWLLASSLQNCEK
jgi:hypothetical protein